VGEHIECVHLSPSVIELVGCAQNIAAKEWRAVCEVAAQELVVFMRLGEGAKVADGQV
jgi:hypothetical protein